MTIANMIEEVRMVFPSAGDTLVTSDIYQGQRDMASKALLHSVAFEDWTTATDLSGLANEFYQIKTIVFYDSADNVRYTQYKIQDDLIVVGNDDVTTFSGEYYYLPTNIAISIAEEFHEGLVQYALAKTALRAGDQRYQAFLNNYKEAVRDAKKKSNSEDMGAGLHFNLGVDI